MLTLAGWSGSQAGGPPPPPPPPGGLYFTIAPCRLLDTRSGSQLVNGVPLTVQATGQCGIPAGTSAIAFNPVAIAPTGDGFFQFYPGSTPPVTSAINFRAGKTRASNAIVDLTAAGAFTARPIVSGGGSTDLVIDVFGYFFIPPTAVNDSYSTAKNVPLLVPAPGVLANDTGNQNQAQPFNGASTHGTVVLLADGSFTYTPTSGYFGPDSFPYTVQNPAGSANGSVLLSVTEPPTITSANNATFPPGVFTTFTVTTTGYPTGASMAISETGALPSGVSFVDNHDGTATISGIASGTGSFPIVITAANGIAPNATQNFTVQLCPVITVTNPATTTGTVNVAFSQTFTQTGASGTATFTTSSTLPAGLNLASNGTLSGTPTQSGSFPIVVTVTDSQGCTGTSPTYTLVIACQTITVTNPGVSTGTANSAFSQVFTAGNTVGAVTFTVASGVLPAGMGLAANGTLSGTPTQTGSFPITVKATDANGCQGTGATYTLVINCQTITVTNPAINTGTVSAFFSQTFTQSNAIGTATFTTASTLPAGMSLSTAGVLSGTPQQPGTFPIVVTVTDANGCTGTGATYNLTIGCQVITVTKPATSTGTVGTAFSQIFTQTGAVGGATFTTASTLPTGIGLATNGTLSGTPTQSGTFPIVVTVTDGNGCTGTSPTYSLVISCQAMTLSPTALPPGTSGVLYPSVTFTQTGGIGAVVFSQTGALPTGMGFAVDTLSGTPTQTGSFPIHVTATDSHGCTAARDYLLVVACPGTGITVSPSSLPTVTANTAFPSTQFTGSGGVGPYTFSEAGALPSGMSFVVDTLQGTPTQVGTFPITISAVDSNGCAGSQDYVVTVTCNGVVITVNPPALAGATVGTPFAPVTFTGSGGVGPYTFSEAGALPTGMSFSVDTLSGTPTQPGTFPISVTATDSNGCTGATNYSLVVVCQTITVNNPGVNTGTVDAAFSQTFTQTGASGTATFTTTSTLPSGMNLSSAGVLSGTPGQPGSFPIVVKVTDSNGCTGTGATYTLVVACQTITVTKPAVTTGTVDAAFSQSFTQSGVGTHTPATFTLNSGSLPSGMNLSSAGLLSGTPGQPGSFPITVKVTDANGCTGISSTYTLVVACQTITVTKPVVTTGTYNTAFSQTFTQSGVGTHTPATFTTASTLPTGLGLSAGGVLSGTPLQTGIFPIVVTVTDANGCTGTSSTYSLAIGPKLTAKAYTDVGNTQLAGGVVAPSTPSVAVVAVSNGDTSDTAITYAVTVSPTHGALTTFNSTGTFLYTPNAGNTTSDAFTYTGTSNGASSTQTATIAFNGMVWYVDNATASGTNDGRSNTPFKTMTAANGAATSNGDFIYVAKGTGTTTGAYTMKPSQKLIGAGATLNVPTVGPILTVAGSAANTPTIGGTITLANSVTVDGIDMSTGSSRAITNFNGATYSTVTGVAVTARSVASSTGTAIDIQGSGNTGTMAFTSISASGGSNGIVLTNFTGGSFTVNGDGANTSVGGNGTGGTISGMSGANGAVAGSGIYLNNVQNVTLRRMTINGTNTNFGIRGFRVDGFTFEYSTVAGTNGTNNNAFPDDSGEGSIYFGNTVTNGLATQGTFTKNNISGGAWDNLHIENTTAGTTTVTVKGNTFGLNGTINGNQSFIVEARNAGTIINSVVGGPLAGEPNTFLGAPGGLANFTGQTGTTMDVQFKNNVMSNSHPNNNVGGGCLTLASQGVMTFVVDSNSMRDADGSTMTLQKASLGTSFSGRVTNNTLGVTGVLKSASKSGNGIFLSAAGAGTIGLTITGNQIRNWAGNAAMFFDNTGGSYTANFTIQSNTMAEPGSGSFSSLAVTNGGNLTSDTVNVCAVIGGAGALKNTITGAAGLADLYLGSSGQNGGHTFNLPGYAGPSNLTNVQTFVTGNNTLSGGATVIAYDDNGGQGSFTGIGTSCPTP